MYPVIFKNEVINIDSVINRGGFLCLKPGIYHFSFTVGFEDSGYVITYLMHNAREVSFAGEESYSVTNALMLELNLYDTVELKVTECSGAHNSMMNSFEGRLLP